MSDLLNVFGNAIWVGATGTAIYLGLKNDIKELRKDMAVVRAENTEAHNRHEKDLEDHESRLRQLERNPGAQRSIRGWAE